MLQSEETAAEHPRWVTPEATVPSFERVPGLHGNEAVTEVALLAEPRDALNNRLQAGPS